MIYLYLKTHNKTGFKYLGKTIADPYAYKGSGKVWKRHIDKHGYDVTTEILFQTEDKEEFKKVALKFSTILNVVESKEFANIVPEAGDGGPQLWKKESRMKLSENLKSRNFNPNPGKGNFSDRHKESLSKAQKTYLQDSNNRKEHLERLAKLRTPENREKISKTMSTLKWCNDGVRNYRLKVIPDGFQPGRL